MSWQLPFKSTSQTSLITSAISMLVMGTYFVFLRAYLIPIRFSVDAVMETTIAQEDLQALTAIMKVTIFYSVGSSNWVAA